MHVPNWQDLYELLLFLSPIKAMDELGLVTFSNVIEIFG